MISMHPIFIARGNAKDFIPIWFVHAASWPDLRGQLPAQARAFAEAASFTPKPGRHLALPGAEGALAGVLFAIEAPDAAHKNLFLPGKLPGLVPAGAYRFANAPHDVRLAALAFALGTYRFTRYRKEEDKDVRLAVSEGVDAADLTRTIEGVSLARDLINTPANDMGPAELEATARTLAARHGASIRAIIGNDLTAANFPLIHAVGRAAAAERAPRLIDVTWGDLAHPKITLVGKGVCFDTGGVDIKPEHAMLNMKKDMGGAATVLALAHMIMDRKLKVRLRVLVPAVENAISASAFRPRDIYRSRKGISVEIGNTDAEGRLILADALALADEEAPELIVDMATLTGAARVALGPEVPPFYTDDDVLAGELTRHAGAENDPLWRLPLWRPYDEMLDSKVADVNNVVAGGFAGSIIAALFLRRFVENAKAWLHLDIFAWTPAAKPARPEGAECQAARALYALFAERYG
jgi:leucyl aminopeptidase